MAEGQPVRRHRMCRNAGPKGEGQEARSKSTVIREISPHCDRRNDSMLLRGVNLIITLRSLRLCGESLFIILLRHQVCFRLQ